MLKQFKEEYFSANVQFVYTNNKGVVLESDQAFLKVNLGVYIEDTHPFFNCIYSIPNSNKKSTIFNCVQIGENVMDCIVDVEIYKKKEGFLLMIHDLTEHYVSYQAIAQARNESIINSELVVLKNIELEEREKFKNQFIRNFSHELRNPLTSIISITSIIQNTGLTDEQNKMLDFLKASNANLKLMLEDILSIGMIASGKLKLNPQIFSLSELVELLKFTYSTKAKEKALNFNIQLDTKIPDSLHGDRLRLFQILTNLLDNAFKYTNNGEVNFKVDFNQKWANRVSLRFAVIDTGNGIPSENFEHIFESFSQLEVHNKKGTGLGLPIVKGLLELMDSKIQLQSTLGKGSHFYFDVVMRTPLPSMTKLNLKKVVKTSEQSVASSKNKKYKVLLVEDDEQVQMMLFKTLINAKCFHIDFESDGAEVMNMIVQNEYDLILMDVMLPNVNGDHLTKLIREFPFNNIKKTPILGITANAFADDIERYKKSGMNALITKPFDGDDLLKNVFKILKK